MAIERRRSFRSTDHPGPVPRDRTVDRADDDEPINLWPIIDTAREFKWVILLVTALCPVVVLLASLLQPKTYEATASISLSIPVFPNELSRGEYGIQAYRQFARSDQIRNLVSARLAQVGNRLRQNGLGEWNAVLYDTEESAHPLLPMIGLRVRAGDPQWAQQVANAWAVVLSEQPAPLSTLDNDSVDFILKEHPKAREVLDRAERALHSVRDTHTRAYAQSRFRETAVDLTSDLETNRVTIQSIEEDLVALAALSGEARARVEHLGLELKNLPQAAAGLAGDLARERANVAALQGRDRALRDQLSRVRRESNALRHQLLNIEGAENALLREQAREAAPLERAVNDARAIFVKLDRKLPAANLAKLQPRPSIQLGSPAAVPAAPIDRGIFRKTAIALPFGAVASAIIVGVMLQLRRRPRLPPSP